MTELQMPKGKYDEDRRFEFDVLAEHAFPDQSSQQAPIKLRIALSNLFVSLTGRRSARP